MHLSGLESNPTITLLTTNVFHLNYGIATENQCSSEREDRHLPLRMPQKEVEGTRMQSSKWWLNPTTFFTPGMELLLNTSVSSSGIDSNRLFATTTVYERLYENLVEGIQMQSSRWWLNHTISLLHTRLFLPKSGIATPKLL